MMSRILLVLAGMAAALAVPSPAQAQADAKLASPPSGSAATRTLVCHGGPGIQVRVHADPSPSWTGPASFPAKPVRMALRFAGGAPIATLADAENLPAGACAWIGWDSRLGGPPAEVYVDVNAAGRPDPNPISIRANLADAKRFYLFPTRLMGEGPLASYRGEWIPGASSHAAGPATERSTRAGVPILRQLMCRGGPSGFEFKVIADPSPAQPKSPRYVRLAIRYRINAASDTAELVLGRMSPGSCGWEMRFGAPEPPGEVIIDIPADGQASNVSAGFRRDTSASAALAYPDTASVRRYLSDPSHFWTFYHLDRGEPLSTSHGAYKPDLTNLVAGRLADARTTASGTPATTSNATTVFRATELRCRGGSGLAFAPGRSVGENQVLVMLSYSVSPAVPGETGRSLAPGSCAWVDRTGLAREPGKVGFVTAGNAQLRQIQSGSAVDRSPTAAERWPDAHTIPVYMADPSRFWRFTVVMVNPDSARQHGPWKPSLADAIAGPVTEASSTRAVRQAPVVVNRSPTSGTSTAAPAPGASIAGPLRGTSPGAAASPVGRTLATDTVARRSAIERTPAPTNTVAGGLRDGLSGKDTLASTRALPATDTPSTSARTSIPQVRTTRIYNVRTAPGPRGVRLTFDATGVSAEDREVSGAFLLPGDPLSSIIVRFSRTRPTWSDRKRTWSFPEGSNSIWSAEISYGKGGGYQAVPRYDLEAGNQYYYLITVFSSDESSWPAQRTGSFTADIRHTLGELFGH